MGVVLALVAVDDLLDGVGSGLPGFAATGSFIALAYAYSIRFLAPGMTTVETGIMQVPTEVTASAQSLGAGPLSVVRRIHLPLGRSSVLAAAILVGVDALKELPIAYLLRPVGFDTLPVWVYDLASESRFEQAALPALTIIAVALVPVAMLSRHLDQPAVARRRRPVDVDDGRRPRHPRRAQGVRRRRRGGRRRPTVGDHELVALVGPSGCGKSTLLRLAAGLAALDSGEIRIGGDVVDDGVRRVEPEHRRAGLVFQEHALFPHLSVADNITFGLRGVSRAARAARCEHWLGVIGLAGHGDRYPHELSGGERQRVALARALAPEPRLVLLDEPFASLDPNLRARLRTDIVDVLRSTGTPALFVTHDQAEALSVGDRVAVMRAGRIEQDGPPDDVYHRPANRFVAAFMSAATFLPVTGGSDRARPVRGRRRDAARRASAGRRAGGGRRRRCRRAGDRAGRGVPRRDADVPGRPPERHRDPGDRRRTPSTPKSGSAVRATLRPGDHATVPA